MRVRDWIWVLACIAAGVAVYLVARHTRPIVGLGNHDVAGITYNADVLLRGGFPYIDTVEIKAPGAFYLVAAAFHVFGRSVEVLHATCEAWMAIGTVGLWFATTRLYTVGGGGTRTARRCAAVACGLFWCTNASFQSNYTTWLVPPTAWCFAFALQSWRSPRWWWPWLTGLMAGGAFLIKANGVVLGPAVLCGWWWMRRRGCAHAAWRQWPLWIAGGLSAGLPLVLHYVLVAGDVWPLVEGVLPFGAAAKYSSRPTEAAIWWIPIRVLLHLEAKFPLQIMAAGATVSVLLVRPLPRSIALRREHTTALGLGLLFACWSVVGGGLGGLRYFRHYAPQYLPALCMLAAHPAPARAIRGLGQAVWGTGTNGGEGPRFGRWERVAMVVLALALGGFAYHAGVEIRRAAKLIAVGKYSHGWRPRSDDRTIADFIQTHSAPDDRIFIWGWRGWSIYFYTDRRAPTPMYKGLGTITTFNFNGLFRPEKGSFDEYLHFVPGPHADALVAAFEHTPPAFVVRAKPFFDGAKGDPMREFDALKTILDGRYEKVFRSGKLTLYEYTPHRTARLGYKFEGKRRAKKKATRPEPRARPDGKPRSKPGTPQRPIKPGPATASPATPSPATSGPSKPAPSNPSRSRM